MTVHLAREQKLRGGTFDHGVAARNANVDRQQMGLARIELEIPEDHFATRGEPDIHDLLLRAEITHADEVLIAKLAGEDFEVLRLTVKAGVRFRCAGLHEGDVLPAAQHAEFVGVGRLENELLEVLSELRERADVIGAPGHELAPLANRRSAEVKRRAGPEAAREDFPDIAAAGPVRESRSADVHVVVQHGRAESDDALGHAFGQVNRRDVQRTPELREPAHLQFEDHCGAIRLALLRRQDLAVEVVMHIHPELK